MLADYHIHTEFSDDSECTMEAVAQRAVEKGLDEICFTDHVDLFDSRKSQIVDYDRYFAEYEKVKKKYKNKLSIKIGIEFAVQMHTKDKYWNDYQTYPFDFVILSNHQIDDKEFWTGEFQKGKTRQEYNQQYYMALEEVITHYKGYSVLGHLDMIKRYDEQGSLEDFYNEEIIKRILKMVIQDGKGIELNTSSFRYQLPDSTPSRHILKWYQELGGSIITTGSDSHEISHLGESIPVMKQELKKLGFQTFCTFQQLQPISHDL